MLRFFGLFIVADRLFIAFCIQSGFLFFPGTHDHAKACKPYQVTPELKGSEFGKK